MRFNFAVHTKFVDLIKLSADFHILALSWVICWIHNIITYMMIIYNKTPVLVAKSNSLCVILTMCICSLLKENTCQFLQSIFNKHFTWFIKVPLKKMITFTYFWSIHGTFSIKNDINKNIYFSVVSLVFQKCFFEILFII